MNISLEAKINAIKRNSSLYNYYMMTPLNELHSKDEKLIKKALEQKYSILTESDEVEDTAMKAATQDSPKESHIIRNTALAGAAVAGAGAATYGGIVAHFMQWKNSVGSIFGDTVSDFKGRLDTAIDKTNETQVGGTLKSIWNYISDKLGTAWDYTGGKALDYIKPYILQFSQKIADKVVDLINYFTNGEGLNTTINASVPNPVSSELDNIELKNVNVRIPDETIKDIAQKGSYYTITGAIIIIAVVAIWKIIKFFIRDDGNKKSDSEMNANIAKTEDIDNSTESEQISESRIIPVTAYGNPFNKKFNPMYNNLALAIITEMDEQISSSDSEAIDALDTSKSKGFIIDTATKMADSVLSDSKFNAYTMKASPELLEDIKKWQSTDKSVESDEVVSESSNSTKIKGLNILTEADDTLNNTSSSAEVMPIEPTTNSVENGSTTGLFNSITNAFKRAGSATVDSVNYVKDKIVTFKKNFFDKSPHLLVRWMPAIIESAIAVLAIYYLWNKRETLVRNAFSTGKELEADNAIETTGNETAAEVSNNIPTQESKAVGYMLKKYTDALTLVTEVTDKLEKEQKVSKSKSINADKILENISGTGEKLGNNIITKAKSASVDLLDDSEFITFSKKYPELLDPIKKINKYKG